MFLNIDLEALKKGCPAKRNSPNKSDLLFDYSQFGQPSGFGSGGLVSAGVNQHGSKSGQ
jgi:hypothetical protein